MIRADARARPAADGALARSRCRKPGARWQRLALLAGAALLAGCATLRSNLPRPPPSHEQYNPTTTLARAFAPREADHPTTVIWAEED